jgi:hypothetical protein
MTTGQMRAIRPAAPGMHRAGADTDDPAVRDSFLRRRIGVIWGLLLANAMPWIATSVLPVPQTVSKVLLAGALALALLLALRLNPGLVIRPNVLLSLATLLGVISVMTSVRGEVGVGGLARSLRLCVFVAVLWLLTPWWGRRDLLFVRCHLRALLVVLATVLAGVLLSPAAALGGRLKGVIWPIPPPQVAQYAAVVAGTSIILWMSGALVRRQALVFAVGGVGILLLTHTRTAVIALIAGVVTAASTLLLSRRRARRALIVTLLVVPLALVVLAPAVVSWYKRGQTSEAVAGLTGRKQVWESLLRAPRSEFDQWFGLGLSDKSFNGLSVDSTWLAVYQDQGLVGAAIVAAMLLFLLIAPVFRPSAPGRAVVTFLVVYCAVASYTEVGLGDASPYLLHLVVAASLLASAADVTSVQDNRVLTRPTRAGRPGVTSPQLPRAR